MTSQGLFGANQGASGVGQGFQGATEGAANGATTGMQRAASGGMNPQPSSGLFSNSNSSRQTQGFNVGSLAPFANLIPGAGPFIGAGLSMIGSMQAQQQAQAAQQAAQAAQGNALAGASGLAGELAGPPDYSGIINAGNAQVNTVKQGVGGTVNQNDLTSQMAGNNLQNSISGANKDQQAGQAAAAGILQGNATQYNNIGTQAGAGAAAQGNPFSLFTNALQSGGGLAGIFGGKNQTGNLQASSGSLADAGGLITNPGAEATYSAPSGS